MQDWNREDKDDQQARLSRLQACKGRRSSCLMAGWQMYSLVEAILFRGSARCNADSGCARYVMGGLRWLIYKLRMKMLEDSELRPQPELAGLA